MKRIIQITMFVVVALLSTPIQGQQVGFIIEVEDESEFDYKTGSEKGPEKWGHINKDWEACSDGQIQSPIDLFIPKAEVVPTNQKIDFFYSPSHATMKNRGHDIVVKFDKGTSKISIDSTDYVLSQFHWHSPSEHTLQGKKYDMELHLVHISSEKKIAVVGLLFQLGEPDMFLNKMMGSIKAVLSSSEEIEGGEINPAEIMEGRGKLYYRYTGSLTTPPCTEGVLWTVDTKIGTVSDEQLKLLRQCVNDHAEENARPVQPSNGRSISLFESS